MAFIRDKWVERLRDGTAAPSWPVHLVAVVLVLGAPALIVAEFRSPTFVAEMARSSRVGSVVLVELLLVVVGFAVSIGTWWSGRRDRRVLARIRASGHRPAFFLPVLTKGIRTRVDYAIWFGLDAGSPLVLTPRTSLGRPFEAGPGGLETLLPVVRALRRELDHRPRPRSPAR